ncbi:MAG: UDP-N-acetylglucosamine 2-epimerase (non-hydrolyzing) [Chloroflexi bacterium UTCFX4]|jgi:UDP-N-acetylglucosamine 2-epimerase (non-hydrolysing)|nr:MAG: UDP-N-acetylglucosamine 2-epimerase (non-hydrolyzing) [Chloroflexi bacterium UTCFX4]
MKVMTVFGTRPEIIRLSQIIKQLDKFCDHLLVHTGQNYDPNLSDIFFRELDLRAPDIHLGIQATGFADQAGQIIARCGELFAQTKPDRVLILGDTNSGLAAFSAARLGIPVYHLEAGNRCYDDRVPEEINRRIIDHCSSVLMPYTQRSKENLLREGIERQRIFVIGNPIYEVLQTYATQIEQSDVLTRLNIESGKFFLVTLHRAENVDDAARLEKLLRGLALVADTYAEPMVVSLHPRTADKLTRFGLDPQSPRVRLLAPLGLFDFVKLEKRARCVLSDSGTVQEECSIFGAPNVTLRDVTERAETIEVGSNILAGAEPEMILGATRIALETSRAWQPPAEYVVEDVARTVVKVTLGYWQ